MQYGPAQRSSTPFSAVHRTVVLPICSRPCGEEFTVPRPAPPSPPPRSDDQLRLVRAQRAPPTFAKHGKIPTHAPVPRPTKRQASCRPGQPARRVEFCPTAESDTPCGLPAGTRPVTRFNGVASSAVPQCLNQAHWSRQISGYRSRQQDECRLDWPTPIAVHEAATPRSERR